VLNDRQPTSRCPARRSGPEARGWGSCPRSTRVALLLEAGCDRRDGGTGTPGARSGGRGASYAALLGALTGRIAPRGRLPFELPRSMDAVRASRPDVPSDTEDPLYPVGAGLDL
jgi:hypothetical protein